MGVAAFPRVPDAARRAVPDGASLRAFGADPADLDVDFDGGRAELTTALLVACAEPPVERAVAARLPISVRIRAVLRLAATEVPIVELACTCACGEQLELALPLAEVATDPPHVADAVEVDGRTVRVPTGEHQHAAEASAITGALGIARLLVDCDLTAGELRAIDAALDAADPLVCFHITACCPACGAAFRRDVDLEAIAHRHLAAAQHQLLDAIHRLASAYHWTEREVLALPRRRRAHYLARIERGER
jgi:hypothetical protein